MSRQPPAQFVLHRPHPGREQKEVVLGGHQARAAVGLENVAVPPGPRVVDHVEVQRPELALRGLGKPDTPAPNAFQPMRDDGHRLDLVAEVARDHVHFVTPVQQLGGELVRPLLQTAS